VQREIESFDLRGLGRLLIVVNVTWFFLSHRLALALAARKSGYDVIVASGGSTIEERQQIEQYGLQFVPLRLDRSERNPLANFLLLISLWRLYRRLRPDIVHHVTIKPVLFGTLAARFARVPAVVNAVSGLGYAFLGESLWRNLQRAIVRATYRFCVRHPRMTFIFQNADDAADVGEVAPSAVKNFVIIPGSGVDLQLYNYTPITEAGERIRVLLPARMLRDKGVIEFAEAIAQLRSEGLAVDGLLAGNPDPHNLASLTEAQLRDLERDRGVQWLGHVTDMPSALRAVDIVCLPSYREGLPKSLIEAAAIGRPLVTCDVPGCREVVEDGVNGYLVQRASADALAVAIRRLAGSFELRQAFGLASRQRAEQRFGIDAILEQTLDVYRHARHARDQLARD
jgi:glycosyltransferase involved in cell wall biosynthesis